VGASYFFLSVDLLSISAQQIILTAIGTAMTVPYFKDSIVVSFMLLIVVREDSELVGRKAFSNHNM